MCEHEPWHFQTLAEHCQHYNIHSMVHKQRIYTLCLKQEARPLPTNRPVLVHADVVLSRAALWWTTAIYWPDFPTFTYPSPPVWCPQWGRSPWAIGLIFGTGKLEWLGYNVVKRHTMINSFGHNTSTWRTDRQQQQMPCHDTALGGQNWTRTFLDTTISKQEGNITWQRPHRTPSTLQQEMETPV